MKIWILFSEGPAARVQRCIHKFTHTCTCTHAHTHTHIHTHAQLHTHTHIVKHTRTHTHIIRHMLRMLHSYLYKTHLVTLSWCQDFADNKRNKMSRTGGWTPRLTSRMRCAQCFFKFLFNVPYTYEKAEACFVAIHKWGFLTLATEDTHKKSNTLLSTYTCTYIEQIELQAKLLNYFLGSHKSNINQFTYMYICMCHNVCIWFKKYPDKGIVS